VHGVAASRARARELIERTKRALEPLGPSAEPIRRLADFVYERRS
jgi:geranylgeranyl pyrophosphate synthase